MEDSAAQGYTSDSDPDRGGQVPGEPDVDDPAGVRPGEPRVEPPRVTNDRAKRHGGLRLGAVIAVAFAAGFVAWLVFRDDGSSSAAGTSSGATAATPAAL